MYIWGTIINGGLASASVDMPSHGNCVEALTLGRMQEISAIPWVFPHLNNA